MMVEKDASDLYSSSGAPPGTKTNGALTLLEDRPLTSEQIREIAWSVMDEEQCMAFSHRPQMNLAIYKRPRQVACQYLPPAQQRVHGDPQQKDRNT